MLAAVLIILILGGIVGALLHRKGRRWTLLNDHPHCRKCGFNLHGLSLPRDCPECGHNTAHYPPNFGTYRRNTLAIGIGAMLWIGSVALLVLTAFNAAALRDWQRFVPIWYLRSSLSDTNQQAPYTWQWEEIRRRNRDGSLTPDDYESFVLALEPRIRSDDLVQQRWSWLLLFCPPNSRTRQNATETALTIEADLTVSCSDQLMAYLTQQYIDGLLSVDQTTRWLQNAARPELILLTPSQLGPAEPSAVLVRWNWRAKPTLRACFPATPTSPLTLLPHTLAQKPMGNLAVPTGGLAVWPASEQHICTFNADLIPGAHTISTSAEVAVGDNEFWRTVASFRTTSNPLPPPASARWPLEIKYQTAAAGLFDETERLRSRLKAAFAFLGQGGAYSTVGGMRTESVSVGFHHIQLDCSFSGEAFWKSDKQLTSVGRFSGDIKGDRGAISTGANSQRGFRARSWDAYDMDFHIPGPTHADIRGTLILKLDDANCQLDGKTIDLGAMELEFPNIEIKTRR